MDSTRTQEILHLYLVNIQLVSQITHVLYNWYNWPKLEEIKACLNVGHTLFFSVQLKYINIFSLYLHHFPKWRLVVQLLI